MLEFIGSSLLLTFKVWVGATIIWILAIIAAIPIYFALKTRLGSETVLK